MNRAIIITAIGLLLANNASLPAARGDDLPAKSSPAAPADPLTEARALTDQESWAEAGGKFGAFLEKNPTSPLASEARFWAGYCCVKLEEHERALDVLRPFLTTLSEDTWADDALLKLGAAHHGLGQEQDALECWKRLIEKYPGSVWRTEGYLNIIDVLFHHARSLAECLAYCERLTKEVDDRPSTTEARYLGAYCLNALRRFDESDAWANRSFDPESPLEEAWRRLLAAQRDLLRGRAEVALAAVDTLTNDFPDLDHDARTDLLRRTCYLLRFNRQADRARDLMLDELQKSAGRGEDEIGSLIDELCDIFGDERRTEYYGTLKGLSGDPHAPLVVRVIARERRAGALREIDADLAVSSLRDTLRDDPTEYGRVRAARQLAEILAEDRDDRAGAVRVLDELLPALKRRDLIHQVRCAADELRAPKP